MLNERETILALEEAMRGGLRFWKHQGYDERDAFIKTLEEVENMETDPMSPCGETLDINTKMKFIKYRKIDLGMRG